LLCLQFSKKSDVEAGGRKCVRRKVMQASLLTPVNV
jgi:hypothetical protein